MVTVTTALQWIHTATALLFSSLVAWRLVQEKLGAIRESSGVVQVPEPQTEAELPVAGAQHNRWNSCGVQAGLSGLKT